MKAHSLETLEGLEPHLTPLAKSLSNVVDVNHHKSGVKRSSVVLTVQPSADPTEVANGLRGFLRTRELTRVSVGNMGNKQIQVGRLTNKAAIALFSELVRLQRISESEKRS